MRTTGQLLCHSLHHGIQGPQRLGGDADVGMKGLEDTVDIRGHGRLAAVDLFVHGCCGCGHGLIHYRCLGNLSGLLGGHALVDLDFLGGGCLWCSGGALVGGGCGGLCFGCHDIRVV